MKTAIFLFSTAILLIAPAVLFAQPSPPPGGPVPLDGGIGILLAAGAAYGVKKYKESKYD